MKKFILHFLGGCAAILLSPVLIACMIVVLPIMCIAKIGEHFMEIPASASPDPDAQSKE